MYKHILLATDGSPLSDAALDHGLKLAKTTGARVSIITVTSPFPAQLYQPGFSLSPQQYIDESNAFADALLEKTRASAAKAGVACQTVKVENEHPYEAILDAAAKRGCDLIVMASHGRRGVSAILLGSETTKVLTHAKVPVLVYRG